MVQLPSLQPFMIVSYDNLPPIVDFQLVNKATDSKNPMELEELSRSLDPHIRARVAENVNTPLDILEKLAEDKSEYGDFVRHYLIRNPIVPYRVFTKMIDVKDAALKKRIFYKLLEGYKLNKIELNGEEVHDLLKLLAPDMSQLDFVELLERIHEVRDATIRKKV